VLTLIAVAVMVASKIGVAMMAADLVASKDAGDLAVEELTRQMANLTFLGAVGQAVGLALLVAAIFVRRQKVRLAVS
jgi:hypothetical protein